MKKIDLRITKEKEEIPIDLIIKLRRLLLNLLLK